MKISDLRRRGWAIGGSDTGKWIVLFCGMRAERFDSYFAAQASAREECGAPHYGKAQHPIEEVTPETPAPGVSRSFRRMVAAE